MLLVCCTIFVIDSVLKHLLSKSLSQQSWGFLANQFKPSGWCNVIHIECVRSRYMMPHCINLHFTLLNCIALTGHVLAVCVRATHSVHPTIPTSIFLPIHRTCRRMSDNGPSVLHHENLNCNETRMWLLTSNFTRFVTRVSSLPAIAWGWITEYYDSQFVYIACNGQWCMTNIPCVQRFTISLVVPRTTRSADSRFFGIFAYHSDVCDELLRHSYFETSVVVWLLSINCRHSIH